jgi:ribonuclease BN (tRNA processing enzyme)
MRVRWRTIREVQRGGVVSELLMIGTSDHFCSGGRRQAAYLLRAPAGTALIDCGQTTLAGLAALGVARNEIDAIVISHFHADHFGGVPSFLLAALDFEDHRREPLLIAGPKGIEERIRAAARAIGHPLDGHRFAFPLRFLELHAGAPSEDVGPVGVKLFEVHHAPDSCPHGMLIEDGARRIAYSGDSGWFDALPRAVAGADLFLCDCTHARPEYPYHLSLDELSAKRAEFDCGQFVLTHLGREMRARRSAEGFALADDGLVYKI